VTATTNFRSLELSSRYQPIFSFDGARLFGYEGLLVARDAAGRSLPPNAVFAETAASGEELYLDWLARALHLRAFASLDAPDCRLFINISPRAAIEDARFPGVFASVMASFDIAPGQLVIEILEHAVADEGLLADAVARYRALGCCIALDDFGTVASGEGRIERLRPDIVKIARSVVRAAATDIRERKAFIEMVAKIRAGGAAVVVEGVENRAEAHLAFDSCAEYVQGYYFGVPSTRPPEMELVRRAFATLGVSAAPGRQPAPWPIRTSGRAC
jgi:EAL domain-containing protein (putative c-di-GMP-specific phosphodiesterase class I)